MELPRKIGSLTIVQPYDADATPGSFVAIVDDQSGPQRVLARRITPDSRGALALLETRVHDLRDMRNPALARVLGLVEDEGDCWVVEAWRGGLPLSAVVRQCAARGGTLPNAVFLQLAIQLCTGIEAMHHRPGSPSDPLLHLGLSPAAVSVDPDGRPTLGRYGLLPDPTGSGSEYLAPEQTVPGAKPGPSTDVFSLGTLLYELLTLKPMFRADSGTHPRRADLTTQLVEVREVMPGLDKVLLRALSANPSHRYQSAFVLREDLRGLLAGYPSSDVERAAGDFFAPLVRTTDPAPPVDEPEYTENDAMGALLAQDGGWRCPVEDPRNDVPEDTDLIVVRPPSRTSEPHTEWLPDKFVGTGGLELRPLEFSDMEEIATQRFVRPTLSVRESRRGATTPALVHLPIPAPTPLVVRDLRADFGPDLDAMPTVRISRSTVDPVALALSAEARFDADTRAVGPVDEVPLRSAVPPEVPRRSSPAVAPPRVRREEEGSRPFPSMWLAALVAVVVIVTCLGLPSAGILSIVATNQEQNLVNPP